MLEARTNPRWGRFWDNAWVDPVDARYAAKVAVWVRWLVTGACVLLLVYRPALYFTSATYASLIIILVLLTVFNKYIHFRLVSSRSITWRWKLV